MGSPVFKLEPGNERNEEETHARRLYKNIEIPIHKLGLQRLLSISVRLRANTLVFHYLHLDVRNCARWI